MNINKSSENKVQQLENRLCLLENELAQCKKENEEFINIASHDLQAPLRKLSTFVDRLTQKAKGTLDEEMLSYIDRISGTAEVMRSLIDGLASLAEINNSLEFTPCNLNEVLEYALKDLKARVNEAGAVINATNLPHIRGDSLQLREVFKNVIGNCLKFRNTAHNTEIIIKSELLSDVEIKKFNLPIDKKYYKIEISDNGIGFNQEDAEKIFKAFECLHGKSTFKGNGLGLTISKKIIENHKGIVYATAEENKGTVITIILPENI